jgi:hypothetical protein
MIDNIEHSVKNTLDYVGHAAQEVVRAKDSQKATVKVKNFILKKIHYLFIFFYRKSFISVLF